METQTYWLYWRVPGCGLAISEHASEEVALAAIPEAVEVLTRQGLASMKVGGMPPRSSR